jgi:hypothetical protein
MNYKFGLLILLSLSILSCNSDVKFDSEKWKNAGGENIMLDDRLNMSNDLIESHALINKSELEIIELLGSPSRLHGNDSDSAKYFAVKEVYGWDIDPEEMIFIKIEFNDKRKASSAELFSRK